VNGVELSSFGPAWVVMLIVAVLWLGVSALLARIGGWSTLAGPYRARYPVVGERFRFVSASMGKERLPVNYKGCLFMVVNRHGLHISVLFPFRFRSPPLFIPWSAVASVTERPFLRTFGVAVRLRDHWPIIRVPGRAGHMIREAHAVSPSTRAALNSR
jgi:hypothetical protein